MAVNRTIVGYFSSQAGIASAVNALTDAGFQQSQIGVAARSATEGNRETSSAYTEGNSETSSAYNTGAKAGGAWSTLKNFFGGNAAEPYAGEATKETFNDRVVTPDDYGSEDVHSSLAGMSVPHEHARYFGHRLQSGNEGAVLTVDAGGREDEAIAIIKANGGDIGEEAANYEYGNESSTGAAQNIQLFGEVLRVHKDRINSGEVRLRKEVTTTTQTIQVPVTREELVVERVPVTGEQAATGAAFGGEEIRIPLSEERATVEKQAVVREQVRVGKKEVTNTESFDEQVRTEDLKVERSGTSGKI